MTLEESDEAARRAVALERSRIARELHDVVAHSLSVITVQAAGARRVIQTDPARAAKAIGVIERSGRDALLELRRLLGLLRPEDSVRAVLQPSPSLENAPALLTQVNRAGIHAELRIEGYAYRLPADVDLCAYRIVQEGLTNVLKHADDARAEVTIRYIEGALEVEVQDDGGRGSDRKSQNGGTGSGLAGMSQRTAHLGGRLEAGFQGAGYHIRAWLPIER